MRYQNWDVLIFPEKSKIPLQEYKTACHVVHDQVVGEILHQRNNVLLLPTVTSFIPALPPNEPFRVSLHSWENPEPSRYAQSVTKEPELIMFEARLLIDGRLVGAKIFGRDGPWPAIIETSLQMTKNGEMEHLRFPVFHHELLAQSYWNAGDELGRIKVVIAEGCARDPLSTTLERIKNIVGFSFQHAPLDILEASSIAWPNAAMWRQVSFNASHLPQYVSPRHVRPTGVEAHSHSPRSRAPISCPALPPPALGPMLPPLIPIFPRNGPSDPFIEPVHPWRHTSSADVSMPDYSSSSSWASHSRRVTDPMMTDRPERRYDTLQSPEAFDSICEALLPSAPVNTPQNVELDVSSSTLDVALEDEADLFPTKFETPLSSAIPMANSGTAGIKSRKENVQNNSSTAEQVDRTRVSVPLAPSTSTGGAKRQRVVTPVAFKVIDEEDEPRSSPTRKRSQGIPVPVVERRALSGIELNVL